MTSETPREKVANPFETASEQKEKTTALDLAVFGYLAAGAVGILKAWDMDSASGVLLCLLGSIAAFGVVFYVHLRKH